MLDHQTNDLFLSALLKSKDYQGFLQCYFEWKKKQNKSFSINGFSQLAGLTSRNSMGEILKGKRKMSYMNFKNISRALKLNKDYKLLFKLLTYQSEVKLRPKYLENDENIQQKLFIIKQKLQFETQNNTHGKQKNPVPLITRNHCRVYAALGNPETGATIDEIHARTHLNCHSILVILKELEKREVVVRRFDRYIATLHHLIQSGEDGLSELKKIYLEKCEFLYQDAQNNFISNEKLFYQSSFSISKANRSKLKAKLLEVITDFIDTSEECEGDDVIDLTLGLH
jgi:DNA-binding MarR family transcriptional regulator